MSSSDETTRLVRGLEAFAFGAGIPTDDFVRGLRAALHARGEPLVAGVSALPAVGPYRDAAAAAARAEVTSAPSTIEEAVQQKVEPEPWHLAWYDQAGDFRGSIRLVPGPPEAWRWQALGLTLHGDDAMHDGVLEGESLSFAGAIAKVQEAFGAELPQLLAVPRWAQGRRGSARAATTLLERALPRHDVRGAKVELDALQHALEEATADV